MSLCLASLELFQAIRHTYAPTMANSGHITAIDLRLRLPYIAYTFFAVVRLW
jgi:hypothetical protein